MTLFDAFWRHGFQRGQSFLAPEFCWLDLRLVRQHSVEVNPEVSETVRAFFDFSTEGDVKLLQRRRSLRILIQGKKLKKLPSHPLHTHATKNRLMCQSLNHQYKELARKHQDVMNAPIELLTDPAWRPDREADIQMFLSVPGSTSKKQLPGELRNLTLTLFADIFPYNVWTHVYTDGSAEEGMKNGGSWVHIRCPDGDTTSLSVPGGLHCFSLTTKLKYWPFAQLQSTS